VSEPLAYFLTWHTYGTWLPGHERGSVDDDHRAHGTPFAPADADRLADAAAHLSCGPVSLVQPWRETVQAAVVEVCAYRGWELLALHVRTTHVHAVVSAPMAPEKVLNDFKAYATRRLRRERLAEPDARIWSGHGSTRYLWSDEQLAEVIVYVVERQGAPLTPAPVDSRGNTGKSEPGA
jgi:REP element-mobilizing transposase RayT